MIPILYDGALYTTDNSYRTSRVILNRNIYWRTYAQIKADDSLRLGYLADCLSCEVSETLNGAYELKMEYPINGTLVDKIKLFFCIEAKVSDEEDYDYQMFRIYKIVTKIGKIDVYARHISYDLAGYVCGPIREVKTKTLSDLESCYISGALKNIRENTYRWNEDDLGFSTEFIEKGITTHRRYYNDFAGTTGYSNTRNMIVELVNHSSYFNANVTSSEYDIRYKFNLEWDNTIARVTDTRGEDRGAYISYGSDIKSLEYTLDGNDFKTNIVGYVKKDDSNILQHSTLYPYPDWSATGLYDNPQVFLVDRTSVFDEGGISVSDACNGVQPSTLLKPYYFSAKWGIVESIKADIIYLAGTDDYKDKLHVDKLHIGDTVRVIYPDGNIDVKTQISSVTYDVLRENFKKITVGESSKKWYETL